LRTSIIALSTVLVISLFVLKLFCTWIPQIDKNTKHPCQHYADRNREEVEEYRVGNLVLLSTKDLKYQIIERQTEKLMERFVGPYRMKVIIFSNTVELELPSTVHMHLVANISRIC